MAHDIFISYSRKNLEAVKSIKEELESLGFSCWMDLEGIESGSWEFSDHIISAIDGAAAMLFFLSDESQTSEWALNEIGYARGERKHVILVRFNEDALTKKFRFEFNRMDIIDWRNPEEKAKLTRDLRRWTGKAEFRPSASGAFGPREPCPPGHPQEVSARGNAKNRTAYVLLGVCLGFFGIHNFYAGYKSRAYFQLLIAVLSLGYGIIVTWIWAFVEVWVVKKDANGVPFA